ncbi:MAG: fibronectin type III domain-containing protein, partial [candidate division WOR-3 bacterium]|nr:fibronectin type III domain-containing protein [candidate division WOR-3 bacterium]
MLKFIKKFLLIILVFCLNLFAWEKNYGTEADDYGSNVTESEFYGGYIIVGTTRYCENEIDGYLVRINEGGSIMWENHYGAADYREIMHSTCASNYGIISAGEAWRFHPAMKEWSYPFVMKTDYEGNPFWIYRGSVGVYRTLTSGMEISNDVYVATGWAKYGGDPPITVLYWVKFERNERGIGPTNEKFHYKSFAGHAEGYSIQKINNGYIVVGAHWFENIGAAQDCEVYLLKLNDNGDKIAEHTFGGSDEDIGYCVVKTYDGGYVITGCTRSLGIGRRDVYLIKINAYLTKEWERTYGGTKDDIGYGVQQMPDSGYIICGTSQSLNPDGRDEIYFLRVDKNGNKLFERTFGKPQFYCYGSSIKLTSDGGYILVGTERYGGGVPINKGDEVYCIYGESVNQPTLMCFNPVVHEGFCIHWADNSTNEIRFEIDRKIGEAGTWVTIGTANANVTSYCDTDFGLYYGQDVYYRVRAVSEYNSSSPSNEIKVRISGPGIFSDTIAGVDFYHSTRNLFRDNNGNYHLVLKHHNRLWYTKSTNNGQAWSLAKILTSVGPEIPSMVATSTGLPCFVWQEKTGTPSNWRYDLVYAYIDAGGNLHKTTLVDDAYHILWPTIAITADDQIYLAFLHTHAQTGKITTLKFYYNNPQYSVYREFANCNFAQNLRLIVDASNNPHLVWDEYWSQNYQNVAREVRRIYYGKPGGGKEIVAEGFLSGWYLRMVHAPDISCAGTGIHVCWALRVQQPSGWREEIYYRFRTTSGWGNTIKLSEDITSLGTSPGCARFIGSKVFCLANNRIYVIYPHNPSKAAVVLQDVSGYDAVPAPPFSTLGGASAIAHSMITNTPGLYKIGFTIKIVPYVPPYTPILVYSFPSEMPVEFTAYNNSQRLFRDAQGVLHLAFTNGDSVYHTFLQGDSWSEPVAIGQGKYPALALDNNGRLHCIWSYNQGMPGLLEELRYSVYNGSQWSPAIPLMHTYNSFFWGVGAPSLVIKDSIAYITFKSYFGPTYHPEPGSPAPQV